MPSNYRESLAILPAIKALEHDLKCEKVEVLSDNVAAVAYINNLGGSSPSFAALASAAWITTYELGIELYAKHLAGKENVHADHLSRLSPHKNYIAYDCLMPSIALAVSQTLICPSTIASVSIQAPVAWMISLR